MAAWMPLRTFALRAGEIPALSDSLLIPVDVAHRLIHHGGETGIGKLSERAAMSPALNADVLKGIQAALESEQPEPLEKRSCAGEA